MVMPSANILIVEARFYSDIADELVKGATSVLEARKVTFQRVAVPGVFEIPFAINWNWKTNKFDGCISLGCVIRGETDHYHHICREVSRKLMDVVTDNVIPHGFGVLTCENLEQALQRANVNKKNLGARSAEACLSMMAIKRANMN